MDISLRWNEVIRDPFFKDIPFKVELNKIGQILMSPANNWHGYVQAELAGLFRHKKKHGKVINECSVLTRDGVKVADVAWASDDFIKQFGFETPYKKAPEICVEILSPGNALAEIDDKIALYLERGAVEVWVVDQRGNISYFANVGALKSSTLIKGITLK